MFLLRRPSSAAIERFLRESQDAPLSYGPVGLVENPPRHRRFDEQAVTIGRGADDFRRARAALMEWKQFDTGWTELFPRQAPTGAGTVVAVVIRHLGFWSINGARVLYPADASEKDNRFGYAYGTLTTHAESGEELFEVFVDPQTGDVIYRIRAVSWPQAPLAFIGQPIVRMLQARFRRQSAAAMARAARAGHR